MSTVMVMFTDNDVYMQDDVNRHVDVYSYDAYSDVYRYDDYMQG